MRMVALVSICHESHILHARHGILPFVEKGEGETEVPGRHSDSFVTGRAADISGPYPVKGGQ